MSTLQSIEEAMRAARWSDAQYALRDLLFARPTDAKLHALDGICFLRLSDFEATESCFQRATALDPTFVDAG